MSKTNCSPQLRNFPRRRLFILQARFPGGFLLTEDANVKAYPAKSLYKIIAPRSRTLCSVQPIG